MPILSWEGKSKAISVARSVPYCLLEADDTLSYGNHKNDNLIIQGDNLATLKALIPYYKGSVKCIYADPPYNTGSAFEHYDDNVEHSTWLSLMYPRLELMKELMAEDGSIWISIDDREYANLKLICDEIFGYDCFISNISWQRTYSTRNDSKGIVNEVEHILVYSKQKDWQPNKLPRTAEMDKKYKNPDNDFAKWRTDNAYAPGAATHQGMVYAIQHPFTGELLYPSKSSCWRYQQDEMLRIMSGWCEYELCDIHDEDRRAEICGVSAEKVRANVKAIVLVHSLAESKKKARAVYKRGQWPRFFFTKGGRGGIARKTYLKNVGGKLPTNFWPYTEVGHTDEAKKEILAIFDKQASFATPKPERLIQRVIFLATQPGDLVLDAFLGSGTTAAVAQKMNRHYIGIEMGEHAITHVVPRMKKVIDGEQGGISKAEKWEGGGGYRFYRLGEELFDAYRIIRSDVKFPQLAAHIWFTETHTPYCGNGDSPLLGIHNGTAYYLLYNGILGDKKPQSGNVLTSHVLKILPPFNGPKVIYGEANRFGPARMVQEEITFKKIPTEIVDY
jgi:adenine-specific DNA-methyltransferase